MARTTVNDKINALSDDVKLELIDGAKAGESMTEMSARLNVEYSVVQTLLWQSGTLPWRGAKSIISRREQAEVLRVSLVGRRGHQ